MRHGRIVRLVTHQQTKEKLMTATPTLDNPIPPCLREALIGGMLDATTPGPEGLDLLDPQELVDSLETIDRAISELQLRRQDVYAAALEIIDRPMVSASGRVMNTDRSVSRTGWKKKELTVAIVEQRSRIMVDPETGDRVRVFPVDELGDGIQIRTGTNVCKGLGLDHKDLCKEVWSDKLDWVK